MVVVITTLKGGRVGEDDDDVNEEKLEMVEIRPLAIRFGGEMEKEEGRKRKEKKMGFSCARNEVENKGSMSYKGF